MRVALRYIGLLLFAAHLLTGCGEYRRKTPTATVGLTLDVVYPRPAPEDSVFIVSRVDSSFALGSVRPSGSEVFVNGTQAQVWENGAFLAFFPLDTATMEYRFLARSPAGDSLEFHFPFRFPYPREIPDADSLNRVVNELLPARVTVKENHTVMRTDPYGGYWLFPPMGTTASADSFIFPYFRVPLKAGLNAWVEERFVRLDSSRRAAPTATVRSLEVLVDSAWTKVTIPLAEPLIFQLRPGDNLRSLVLELYGADARIERIFYDPEDVVIRDIRWEPLRDDVLRLTIKTNLTHLWGYDAYYESGSLVIAVRKPPKIERNPLSNRIIALDPGHGGEATGAIGPTRLTEKEANLNLALQLKELLERKDATVILTRGADSTVGIYDRVDYALEQGAEVLISLHNNALADGSDPFKLHGTSVYYYQPQSRTLAEILHRKLIEATGLRDHGLYYQDLALARPTQFPAVLIESAFIIYPPEEILLRNNRFIRRIAKSIVAGLEEYFKRERDQATYYRNGWVKSQNIIKPPIWIPLTTQKTYE